MHRRKPFIRFNWKLQEVGQNGMPVVHSTIVVVVVSFLLVDRDS